jgi:ketosteroid isomerase-like protein
MSQANVEIVRRAFEAYNAGGVEAVLPFYAADVILYTPRITSSEDSVYCGHDGARRMETAFADYFDEFAWEIHEIRDARERVLVRATMTGRIKDSDAPIRQRAAAIVSDFRDGLIGEIRFFTTWQQALAAVGLEK